MYIPVRLPQNAFDLSRPATVVTPPHGKTGKRDPLSTEPSAPSFPPGLRDVGGELDRLLTRLAPSAQSRRSRAEVGLEQAGERSHASTLTSNGQLNAAATSFEKVALTFGASTAVARLSGTYKGTGAAAAATSLSIALDASATVSGSASAIAFRVLDQAGTTLFSYSGNAKAGDSISLGSDVGLSISFEAGTLVAGEAGRTNVSRTVGTDVDVNATFGDTNVNARPRFEGGATVVPGSFKVNGATITVNAEDSIKTILARITEKAPSVAATVEKDKVILSQRDDGRRRIEISDDTSGFVAAVKLAGVATDAGAVGERKELLADGGRFEAVRAGSFRIGGALVSVDPESDSVATVLARMTAAVPGLSAFYDPEEDTVVVRGTDRVLAFEEDSSGFLAALGLDGPRALDPRESMTLPPGAAARLERAAAGRNAELVNRTIAFLAESAVAAETAAADERGVLGMAVRAKQAYGRETEPGRRVGRDERGRKPVQSEETERAPNDRASAQASGRRAAVYGNAMARSAENVAATA